MCCGNKFCCSETKKCFCLESKTFFASRTQILRPKHMFPSLATPGNITRNIVSATMFPSLARPLETTTAMTTTTSQIRWAWLVEWGKIIMPHVLFPFLVPQANDLIGLMRKNNRAARLLVQFFDEVCQMTTWNCQIWGSDNNATYIRKDFILCLYVKTVRSMEVKRRFAYLLQSDIHRLFTKNWTYSEVLFESYVFVGAF